MNFISAIPLQPYVETAATNLAAFRDRGIDRDSPLKTIGIEVISGIGFAALALASVVESIVRGLACMTCFLYSFKAEEGQAGFWLSLSKGLCISAIHSFVIGLLNCFHFLLNPFVTSLLETTIALTPKQLFTSV